MFVSLLSVALAAPVHAPEARGFSAPDRTFDMEKLRLELNLDPEAGAVSGTATWTARRLGEGPLVFDQVALTIEEVRVDGEITPWRVAGDTLEIDVPGTHADVAIRYRATPRDGLHFRRPGNADRYGEVWSQGEGEDNRHWFPSWDSPNDRFLYEGSYTAPPGWKVLTNTGQDVVNYLVMVAAGPYEVHGDDTVSAWVPPGTTPEGVRRVLDPIPGMMAHLAERTGVPYPWGAYRQVFVQRFLYTGMENTSATVEDRWMVGDSSLSGTRTRRIANVVAHELAHQWYGDLLTCRRWSDLWLNEGFATFFAADWQATVEGPDEWAAGVRRRYQASLGEGTLARHLVTGPDAPANHNVYNKGASVLQMLRVQLGEDTFWRAIRRYTTAHQHALVTSAQLRAAMEDESGQELGWFFQQWVELPYVPALTVTSSWAAGELTVRIRQDIDEAHPRYTLPVEVEVGVAGEAVTRRAWLDEGSVVLHVPSAAAPTYVAFDPRGGVLARVTHEQTPEAWEAQLASPSPYARVTAIAALGQTDHPAALAALAADRSRPFALRDMAVDALGEQRATAALLPLIDEPDDAVRLAVVEALGRGVGADAAGPLAARVERDASPDVVAAALTSLARLAPPTAARLARTRLRVSTPEEVPVLAAAAGVLGEHGTPADLPALLRIVGPERGRTYAVRAAAQLAARQDPGAARTRLLANVARAAEGLLSDEDLRAREAGVALLGEVGDQASVSQLEAFRRSEHVRSLQTAAEAAITAIRTRAAPTATRNELEARLEALERRMQELAKEAEERR